MWISEDNSNFVVDEIDLHRECEVVDFNIWSLLMVDKSLCIFDAFAVNIIGFRGF